MATLVGYPSRETRGLLRLEGAAFAAVALYFYTTLDASWWLFAALILAPDLSALGFLAGKKVGARTYNAFHLWLWPAALGVIGYLIFSGDPTGSPVVLAIALVWAVHIGVDRALGYGLKQADAFEITHLGPIGRAKRTAREAAANTTVAGER